MINLAAIHRELGLFNHQLLEQSVIYAEQSSQTVYNNDINKQYFTFKRNQRYVTVEQRALSTGRGSTSV